MTKKKDEDPIELTVGSECKLVLIGPGETTIDIQGIFKGYIDFMGNGLALVMDAKEKDGKMPKDAPVHSIVPLSSVIYFDIIVEAEKEDDEDDNKKKQRDKMFY